MTPTPDVEQLLRRWTDPATERESPLTAALAAGAADDWAAGGVTRDVLGPYQHEDHRLALPLRLAAALHRLVLTRQAPALALHYPTVGGTAPPAALWPAARDALAADVPAAVALVGLPCQTNEVGRCIPLVAGLQHVARAERRPLRLLEIGASGGLNLLLDRYRYGELGPAGSPCRLPDPGLDPAGVPEIVDRAGCDPTPLDATGAEGRLRLSSSVWGDHVDRFARLQGALAVAASSPRPPVERAGAAPWLEQVLPAAGRDDRVATVVWHSVVRQYVDPEEWAQVERLTARPGVWRLSWEPDEAPGRTFALRAHGPATPPEGLLLASGHGHGPPVTLLGPSGPPRGAPGPAATLSSDADQRARP